MFLQDSRVFFLFALLLAGTTVSAEEIQGRVVQVSGGTIRVEIDSDVVPRPGDPVVVYYQREGSAKRAVVGEGNVARVEGRVVVVTMDDPGSAVQVGHLVQISANPQESKGETPLAFDAAVKRLIESSFRDFEDVRGKLKVVNEVYRIYECTVRLGEAVDADVWVDADGDQAEVRCSMLDDAGEREVQARFEELEKALRILAPSDWTIEEQEYEDVGLREIFWTASDIGPALRLHFWRPGDGREDFSVDLIFEAMSHRVIALRKCQSNLNQLGKGSILYADEHHDRFPPFGPGYFDTLRDVLDDPMCYSCPSTDDPMGDTSYATWSGGESLSLEQLAKFGSRVPLAWDKDLENHGDVRNVLFHEGHVEQMSEEEFEEALQYAERELGLKR
ncbi:MAG: hypothetical protein HY720_09370 [Planctomycetes bacterium]|nr:hypothetical protein [Planctomycetota bacterium]